MDENAVPSAVRFAFKDYKIDKDKRRHSAKCAHCPENRTSIAESLGTTSNFTRHMKTHPHVWKSYQEYQKQKKNKFTGNLPPNQTTLTGLKVAALGQSGFGRSLCQFGERHYSPTSSRAQAIHKSLINQLIVGESLPLRIVESTGFLNFVQTLDPMYRPPCRNTVKAKIKANVKIMQEKITSRLKECDSVNVTVDIWSDRVMRSFIGITAHVMEETPLHLATYTLACSRFVGSHTGERISQQFNKVIEDYKIQQKLDFVITDNAANMKKAFTVSFPSSATGNSDLTNDHDSNDETETQLETESSLDTSIDLDDDTVWFSLDDLEQEEVDSNLSNSAKRGRLSCFAHTLQLCIGDGLNETKGIRKAMSKASKLTSMVHTSCVFKEAFSATFGDEKSIPKANSTRWNSILKQIQGVVMLDHQKLSDMCKQTGHGELILSVKEWAQLKELVDILLPFYEATQLTQGEFKPTISLVVPTVLAFARHLTNFAKKARYLKPLATALKHSIRKRYKGIFANVGMEGELQDLGNAHNFGETVYLTAVLLDPTFPLHWWVDVSISAEEKEVLRSKIKELVVNEAEELMGGNETQNTTSEEEDEPPAKHIKLFSSYKRRRTGSSGKPPAVQYMKYLEATEEEVESCLEFWVAHKVKFPALALLVKKVLAIPASSAPVERVFSRGGIIMRPHRSRLGDEILSNLVFLKCNKDCQ